MNPFRRDSGENRLKMAAITPEIAAISGVMAEQNK
jgi:hypothetical protein